jgi:hypothetical protein
MICRLTFQEKKRRVAPVSKCSPVRECLRCVVDSLGRVVCGKHSNAIADLSGLWQQGGARPVGLCASSVPLWMRVGIPYIELPPVIAAVVEASETFAAEVAAGKRHDRVRVEPRVDHEGLTIPSIRARAY